MILNCWAFVSMKSFILTKLYHSVWVMHVTSLKNSVLPFIEFSKTSFLSNIVYIFLMIFNIPINSEKNSVTYYYINMGLEIDSLSLSSWRQTNQVETNSAFKGKRTATLRELQSLVGLLNFACACDVVLPGRTFPRRIIDITRGIQKPHHHRNLDKNARADLAAFLLNILMAEPFSHQDWHSLQKPYTYSSMLVM